MADHADLLRAGQRLGFGQACAGLCRRRAARFGRRGLPVPRDTPLGQSPPPLVREPLGLPFGLGLGLGLGGGELTP